MSKLWGGGQSVSRVFISLKAYVEAAIFFIFFIRTDSSSCPLFLQVFAFVKSDKSSNSRHRADCHVCECLLEFRIKFEVFSFAFISQSHASFMC